MNTMGKILLSETCEEYFFGTYMKAGLFVVGAAAPISVGRRVDLVPVNQPGTTVDRVKLHLMHSGLYEVL